MWKFSTAGQATDDNMAHAHCMLDTYGYIYSEYVILTAFPLQLWLHEHASVLCYMYIKNISIKSQHSLFCLFYLSWRHVSPSVLGHRRSQDIFHWRMVYSVSHKIIYIYIYIYGTKIQRLTLYTILQWYVPCDLRMA